MLASGGEPVKVSLTGSDGEEIEAIASLTVSGVSQVERYAVSFIIMEDVK